MDWSGLLEIPIREKFSACGKSAVWKIDPRSRFFVAPFALLLGILQNFLRNDRNECGTQIKTKIGLIRHVEQKILALKFRRPLNLTPP